MERLALPEAVQVAVTAVGRPSPLLALEGQMTPLEVQVGGLYRPLLGSSRP